MDYTPKAVAVWEQGSRRWPARATLPSLGLISALRWSWQVFLTTQMTAWAARRQAEGGGRYIPPCTVLYTRWAVWDLCHPESE